MAENDGQRPFDAEFPSDRGDRCHAGRIEQAKDKNRGGGQGRDRREQGGGASVEHGKGGDYAFLGDKAGDERRGDLPVAEAQGFENGGDKARDHRQDTGLRIADDIQVKIEGLEEPDNDRGDKDDGKGSLEEILGLVPKEAEHIFRAGHTVIGQLHHERNGFSLEQGVFGDQRREDPHGDAGEVQRQHNEAAVIREEDRGEKAVNGQFRRTAHKGGEHNGHLAVPLRRQCAAGHDSRDGTAETDEHRHDASSRKTDLAEEFIHDEGHPSHVAAVFQQGEEEKQRNDDGNKAQYGADAVEDPVNDQ